MELNLYYATVRLGSELVRFHVRAESINDAFVIAETRLAAKTGKPFIVMAMEEQPRVAIVLELRQNQFTTTKGLNSKLASRNTRRLSQRVACFVPLQVLNRHQNPVCLVQRCRDRRGASNSSRSS
jgi:hypothetical protein